MKRDYVIALIILLFISNLITLGLMWQHLRSEAGTAAGQPQVMQPYHLQSALSLSDRQAGQYNQIKNSFIRSAQPLADSLWKEKNNLMTALTDPAEDTTRLLAIEENISRLQLQLLRQSIHQYYAVKAILRPDQQTELNNVYYSLFGCGRQGTGNGMGRHFHGGR